jgi:MFS family permease
MANATLKSQASEIVNNKPLLRFLVARVASTLAFQMTAVAVGWQMYALTHSAFFLGLVGLAQFLPMLLLTLVVGHVADRYNRQKVVRFCQFGQGMGVVILTLGSWGGWLTKEGILGLVFVLGAIRAFEGPTLQAMLPSLVTPEFFSRAVAWNAAFFQTASIIGPALGGILYAAGAAIVYAVIAALFIGASLIIGLFKLKPSLVKREPPRLDTLFAGIKFIRRKPIILGAISLDLFAVLLGGATALLPLYAREILAVGPKGLGALRAAPAIGALVMSAVLARKPLQRRVGKIMFAAVIVFGFATIGFAVSTSVWVSLFLLTILGAADVFSVVIRSSLVQLETPDEMRGRVSAVNSLFIGTSNQLGEFESGLTAAWFGGVNAVLIGGIGTIVVVLIWMRLFPDLLHANTLK